PLLLVASAAAVVRAQAPPYVTAELPADVQTVETLKAAESKPGPKRLRPVPGMRFSTYRATRAEIPSADPGSPAPAGGLLPGGPLRSIGGFKIDEAEDMEKALAALKVGEPVQLAVRRPGVHRDCRIELGEGETVGDPGFECRHSNGAFIVPSVRKG